MTYGYKTLDDGTMVPYPIDTQLPEKIKTVALSEIPAYCLSHYRERRINIADMCAKLSMSVIFIDSDTNKYTHQRNVAHDLIQLILIATKNNSYPFLILEDDATLIDSIPQSFSIPKEADLIYWGANKYSIHPNIILSEYDNKYYRICHTQSGHAILIPSYNSAIFLKNILLESLIINQYHDVLLPNISTSKLFLTPKDGPYFYQKDNKNEGITHFKWKTSNTKII